MTKLSLTDREWKEFFIGGKDGIFSIKATKSGIDKNKLNDEKGNIPYITRTDINNGINLFITDKQNSKYKQDNGNVITIGLDTQTVFYQENSFFTGQNIQVLSFDKLNKHIALFIIPLLKIQMRKFSWGSNGATLGRLNKTKIMLPTNQLGNPDWQFMEEYIKQLEQEKIQEIVNYYQNKLLGCLINNQIGGKSYLKKWANFKIEELFSFENKPSKGLNHLDKCENGGINYIGATNRNNGVLDYVKPYPNLIYRGNAIAFIRNGEGAMGYSVYKKEKFIATQDISVGYNENLTEYSGLFITTIADMVRGKYNFGYKRNQSRLNNEILRLPIDEQGNPDWQFMENFIKNIEKNKITLLLNHYRAEPSRAEPSRAEPSRAEPSRAEPSRAEIVWTTFKLSQVFNIKSGVRLTKSEMIDGDIPFIGATEFNNGITEFVNNTNNSLDKNILGVNYNGSVVENFYHPYECIFSDDVKRLELKNQDYANKWVYLFLKTTILQQKEKYQYGYKFNAKRIAKQSIMLPIDNHDEPNWAYIENHIKQIELNHILSIIRYYQTKLK